MTTVMQKKLIQILNTTNQDFFLLCYLTRIKKDCLTRSFFVSTSKKQSSFFRHKFYLCSLNHKIFSQIVDSEVKNYIFTQSMSIKFRIIFQKIWFIFSWLHTLPLMQNSVSCTEGYFCHFNTHPKLKNHFIFTYC